MDSSFDRGTEGVAGSWPVMVLAHNEEERIEACLDSLFQGEPDRRLEVFVMANGCTDRTEELVKAYARKRDGVHLVSIPLGDKCNAWNVFVHETVPAQCPAKDVYFFMDGDARITPGALGILAGALRAHPHAHAASAVPASGRSRARERQEILDDHGLVANLYALRGGFVERARRAGVRIPLRLEGDDGLIGALVKWDLDPSRNGFDNGRIVPCADAGFTFDSLSPGRLSDWRGYWRRMVRYGRRRYEFDLLGPRLRSQGLAGLPRDITELYPESSRLKLRWSGIYTVTNWFALRQMQRYAK